MICTVLGLFPADQGDGPPAARTRGDFDLFVIDVGRRRQHVAWRARRHRSDALALLCLWGLTLSSAVAAGLLINVATVWLAVL